MISDPSAERRPGVTSAGNDGVSRCDKASLAIAMAGLSRVPKTLPAARRWRQTQEVATIDRAHMVSGAHDARYPPSRSPAC